MEGGGNKEKILEKSDRQNARNLQIKCSISNTTRMLSISRMTVLGSQHLCMRIPKEWKSWESQKKDNICPRQGGKKPRLGNIVGVDMPRESFSIILYPSKILAE